MSKTAKRSLPKERTGKFEPDPTLPRLIPTGDGLCCYFLSPTDSSIRKYKLDSPEFKALLDELTLPWRKRIKEEVATLAERYPDSYWPWVGGELLHD
jgi:hypothetical protein